jgi:hypothetical protein
VAVTVQPTDQGDTTTIVEPVAEAGERIAETAAETNSEEVGERSGRGRSEDVLLGAATRAVNEDHVLHDIAPLKYLTNTDAHAAVTH